MSHNDLDRKLQEMGHLEFDLEVRKGKIPSLTSIAEVGPPEHWDWEASERAKDEHVLENGAPAEDDSPKTKR